jgi:hypothetical protein
VAHRGRPPARRLLTSAPQLAGEAAFAPPLSKELLPRPR